MHLRKKLVAVSAIVLSTPLSAAPVIYTFSNVLFIDGGTLTGSFIYDATTGGYSDHNILTTAGRIANGNDYSVSDHEIVGTASQFFLESTSGFYEYELHVEFETALAGGVYSAYARSVTESACDTCDSRYMDTGGELVGAPAVVPVPAAAWLFGSGLVGLIGVARRKKA